jgi:hypothetical protein
MAVAGTMRLMLPIRQCLNQGMYVHTRLGFYLGADIRSIVRVVGTPHCQKRNDNKQRQSFSLHTNDFSSLGPIQPLILCSPPCFSSISDSRTTAVNSYRGTSAKPDIAIDRQ